MDSKKELKEMTKRTYITTTLPYANGSPHAGHLFEFVLADIAARGRRLVGDHVYFNIGLDEHGGKIIESTKGIPLLEFRKQTRRIWKTFAEDWNISHSNFYQTATDQHKEQVIGVWNKLVKDGRLELRDYTGYYCTGCESFKTQTELQEGVCADHPNSEIQEISEENYFLIIDDLQDAIVEHAKTNIKLQPEAKRKELLRYAEEVQNLSVSRIHKSQSNLIQSPDPGHDIYVWIDALLNYILAVGWNTDDRKFFDFWTTGETVQICGPDNLKFQGVIWQYLLQAIDVPLTNRLLVHGTIRDKDGLKLSKTLGNYIDPQEQQEKFGVDAVRYYIAAGLPTYQDSNWDETEIAELHDAHLVNGFGNLARRVTVLFEKNGLSFLLCSPDSWFESRVSMHISQDVKTFVNEAKEHYNQFDFNRAALTINKLNDYGNKLLQDVAPWSKTIEENHKQQCLIDGWWIIKNIIELYAPIIPTKVGEIRLQIDSWGVLRELDGEFEPEPVFWFKPLKQKQCVCEEHELPFSDCEDCPKK